MEEQLITALTQLTLILSVSMVAYYLGQRTLLLTGPSVWILCGLFVPVQLPLWLQENLPAGVSEKLEQGVRPDGPGEIVFLLALLGSFVWLLRLSIDPFVLRPFWRTPYRKAEPEHFSLTRLPPLGVALVAGGARFLLVLAVVYWYLPSFGQIGTREMLLAVLLVPGGSLLLLRLESAYGLTLSHLRERSMKLVATATTKEESPPTREELEQLGRDSWKEGRVRVVRSSYEQLIVLTLLACGLAGLLELHYVQGQHLLRGLSQTLWKVWPGALAMVTALIFALIYARRLQPALELREIQEMKPPAGELPDRMAFWGGLALLLSTLPVLGTEQEILWWVVPLVVGPVMMVLIFSSRQLLLLLQVSIFIRSLSNFLAPVFFFVVGFTLRPELEEGWPEGILVYALVIGLGAPLVSAMLIQVFLKLLLLLAEEVLTQLPLLPTEAPSDTWLDKALAFLGKWHRSRNLLKKLVLWIFDIFVAPLLLKQRADEVAGAKKKKGKSGAQGGGGGNEEDDEEPPHSPTFSDLFLGQLLTASVSDVSLTVVGLAVLGDLLPLELGAAVAFIYIATNLLMTLVFGTTYFTLAATQHGPHELMGLRYQLREPDAKPSSASGRAL